MTAVADLFWTVSYDRTTVDQICERAGVKKGSFYHFFADKAELVDASLEREWEKYRPKLDAIFSASVPPAERIRAHCEFVVQEQRDLKACHGHVLGCPLCTLGTEISTQDGTLRRRVQGILEHGIGYLTTAIRDGHAGGDWQAPDARAKAERIHTYQLGLMIQARIYDDLGVLAELTRGTFELLGAAVPESTRVGGPGAAKTKTKTKTARVTAKTRAENRRP